MCSKEFGITPLKTGSDRTPIAQKKMNNLNFKTCEHFPKLCPYCRRTIAAQRLLSKNSGVGTQVLNVFIN